MNGQLTFPNRTVTTVATWQTTFQDKNKVVWDMVPKFCFNWELFQQPLGSTTVAEAAPALAPIPVQQQ
jgi:hypothetical protein